MGVDPHELSHTATAVSLVGEHAAPDVGGDTSLQARIASLRVLPSAILRSKNRRPELERIRTWVTATRCRAEVSSRSPLRESRWVTAHRETSIGAKAA
jgi:hypothetical protein